MNDSPHAASIPAHLEGVWRHNSIVVLAGGIAGHRLGRDLSEAQQQWRARHGFYLLCPEWPGRDADRSLRAWLGLEGHGEDDPLRAGAMCLRAAVIDWNSFEHPLAVCGVLRDLHPGLPLFVVSSNADDIPAAAMWMEHVLGPEAKFFSGDEGRRELVRDFWHRADEIVDGCLDAPYWKALERYAGAPSVSFHTRTIASSSQSSPSLVDFADFYGSACFSTETSLATAPLDSLLKPKGAIRDAQLKAGRAFGAALDPLLSPAAAGTRFVSCGTSTANRIVVSAFVQPGEFVLADRTCHVSHHYALAYAHARPVFLETFRNTQGFSGPVPIAVIRDALHDLLEAHDALPAAIILTNPTFDGFFCRPDKVIEAVGGVLREYWMRHHCSARLLRLCESLRRFNPAADPVQMAQAAEPDPFVAAALRRIVFLFDEAWSAAAFFHPRLIEFTAMYAGLKLGQNGRAPYASALRIYSTQSTHKSLCALRQGSMIHFRDPLMALPEFNDAFEQSFRAHTTTSPSASIIASLDIARRQAQLEVTRLQDECILLAAAFRREFEPAPGQTGRRGFFVVSAEQMMAGADVGAPELSPQECYLAPTHVTVSWGYPVDGGRMRRRLLESGIQVNKYDQRSLLVIFNVGVERSDLDKLCAVLRTLETELNRAYPESVCGAPLPALPRFSGFHDNRDFGFWAKNLGGFQRIFIDIDPAAPAGQRPGLESARYVAAAFVTPYPPGHPVLVPGQVVSDEDLVYLRGTAIHEVLGAEKNDGRLRIPVFVVESGEGAARS